jgi:hypothetical protein
LFNGAASPGARKMEEIMSQVNIGSCLHMIFHDLVLEPGHYSP